MFLSRHSRESGNPEQIDFTRSHEGRKLRQAATRLRGFLSSSGLRVRFLAIVASLTMATPALGQEKQPPYWASIASGQAMTHTGPGRNYPNVWLYQRRDLPVRVVKKYENWRLIQDPDGAQGWMLVTMLSDRRTAIVKPGPARSIRVGPYESAKAQYMVEHGVVGRIS